MGNSREVLCSLCLTTIKDKQFEIIKQNAINMLETLFLKNNFNEENEYFMCNFCSLKLSAAFEFKEKCIDIEITLMSYANHEDNLPLDLTELYGKEKARGCLISGTNDCKVCRLCMQLISDEFISSQKIMPDAVELYVPEINFSITEDPLICKSCWDSLYVHISFVKDCLNVMTELKDDDNKVNRDVDTHSSLIYSCIKTEPIEIKPESEDFLEIPDANTGTSEQNEKVIKKEEIDFGFEESEQSRYILKSSPCETPTIEDHTETEHLPENVTIHDSTDDHKSHYEPDPNSHSHDTLRLYKCSSCDFISENAADVERHALVHKDPSEIQTCICATCEDRRTPHKKRRRAGNPTTHTCQECGFQTKRKFIIERHSCAHRGDRKISFSCDLCPYSSRWLRCLKRHKMKHMDPSRLEVFSCPSCNFSTTIREDLRSHVVRQHRSETLKCYSCAFETKYKNSLHKHVFTHRDGRGAFGAPVPREAGGSR